MSTILIADDEARIRRLVCDFLKRDGHTIVEAADGKEALNILENRRPGLDMAILDVMMPGMDGWQVCREIRKKSQCPIIMLTAKGDDMDKILGLEYGADDFITKPFNILEVKARIKAIMRRSSKRATEDEKKKIFEKNGLKIDCDSRRVFVEDKEVKLTAKEYDLLELLSFHPNKVYSRENLLNIVW